MRTYRHVVALGSSFAAGPGISPVLDKAAMRSGRNYAHLLASQLGAQLTDLTVSGATTETILTASQRTTRGKRFGPQLDRVPSNADLITVTAGGNDLGLIGGLIRAGFAGWLRSRSLTRPFGLAVANSTPATASDDAIAAVVSGLSRVVAAARTKAPGARVVLVDYLTVLGEHSPGSSALLTTTEIGVFRQDQALLAAATASAASASDADLLQASRISADHGLGSPQPWITGFSATMQPMPFHPNAEGMRTVAAALYQLLSDDSGS